MIEGQLLDFSLFRSFDSETPKFSRGHMAPRLICASTARLDGSALKGDLITDRRQAAQLFREYVERGYVVTFANAAYDLAVLAQNDPTLLPLIFRLLREGRAHDILIAEGLDAIYHGHIGKNADGSDLRKPSTGEVTNRYSLEIVHKLLTGKVDAKDNDIWRTAYALLADIPVERWPLEAKIYPVDDAVNTLEDTIVQLTGRPQQHDWIDLPMPPGFPAPSVTVCQHCKEELTYSNEHFCSKAPRTPHKNLENLPAQVEAAFALQLGAAHSFRTDPEKVAALSKDVEEKHVKAVERFQKKGWIREDGTEDQAAVKRAMATAYGATGPCKRCNGGAKCLRCNGTGRKLLDDVQSICRDCKGLGVTVGRTYKIETLPCRGIKVKGRYTGCIGDARCECRGAGTIEKITGTKTCKNVFDENDVLTEEGCDGTGLDLDSAPLLPRTDKLGVATDRDTAMESGDDELADFGANEFEKSRSTFVPYLIKGIDGPLLIQPNVLVATGRCSYEGCPVHQFPRDGGERECIRARGQWCGYPIEMVLGSTDYSAGELCTLSQYNYWLFGYSAMRDAINESGDPGILHSALAAQVLNIPLEEFLKRLAAKDKFAALIRQSSKPMNFGKPAAMGSAKIVLTNRKKNAGFTVCENGPARNRKGEPGYWGIRFCITVGGKKACGIEKVTEWKKFPTAPVCKACCDVVENILTPAYFARFPEIVDYHKWGKRMIKEKKPVPSVVWDAEAQMPRIIRERGFIKWDQELSSYLNTPFQSMLADIGKDAFATATRECYLGVKDDGSPSPLAGSRLPLFMHDEPVSELILDRAHEAGPRIGEIMVASGKKIAPDVVWKAETAIAFWLNKGMEPVYVEENGKKKLVPWGPIPDYLQDRFKAAA